MYNIDDHGFMVFEDVIQKPMLYDMAYYKSSWDTPQRGHDKDGKYYSQPTSGVVWNNYWTHDLTEHTGIRVQRQHALDDIALKLMDDPVFYFSDASVVMPGAKIIRPHVDTPYRYPPWELSDKRLGLQMALPLGSTNGSSSGTPAFLPGSHKVNWDITCCYRGDYNDEFLEGAVQPEVTFGDVIVWDAATLHSHMINLQSFPRIMLLLNYIDRSILHDLVEYEKTLN